MIQNHATKTKGEGNDMQPDNRKLALALRGGLRGRFQSSFHLLGNALEVLDDQMVHCLNPVEYETLRPLLRQIGDQLIALRRLGEHAADAAIAPVLHQASEPHPLELLEHLREFCELFNEIAVQADFSASAQLQCPTDLTALLTMGDTALLNGLLANLFSNSLAASRSVCITLACAPGLLCYRDDGPGLPPDAAALLRDGTWSERLLEQGGLGLPLIRAYARAMEWDIEVEEGPGLEIRFLLPDCSIDLDNVVVESVPPAGDTRQRRRRYLQRELHPLTGVGLAK